MNETRHYVDSITGRGPFTIDRRADGGRPPNIFLISVDMVPPEFYRSLPGRIRPLTPNLDALRADSTVFSNAFCTSPLCTPSRASFLTGRFSYITTNGERAHDGHAIHLRDQDSIFPEYLKASGYTVRHFGKSHVGTHKFIDVFGENDSPWDRWSPPWNDDDAYRQSLARAGISSVSFERRIRGVDPSGSADGNSYGGWLAGAGGMPFPMEETYAFFVARKAVDALSVLPSEHPLYMQLDFFEPHQPFAIPGGLEQREREIRSLMTLPETYRAIVDNGFRPPWDEPRVYALYRKNWGLRDAGAMLDYLVAHILQFEVLDSAIGLFLEELRSRALYEDAWIAFLADHGEMNGEWALIDKGAYLNPRVLRVPLFLKPGKGATRRTSDFELPVSLLDVAPTLLEVAGISTPERLDGMSLNDQLSGTPRPESKPILADVWSHVVPNPAVSLVFRATDGRTCLYSFNAADDRDELYVLEPSAVIRNIAASAEESPLFVEAVRALDRVLASDVRFRGYSSFIRLRHAELLADGIGDRQLFI